MSEKTQLILMAEYNQLMNQRIFKASSELSKESLHADRGAFFKSVLVTLSHIMIGDILWLKRFSAHPADYVSLHSLKSMTKPGLLDQVLFEDFSVFKDEREKLDKLIIDWCDELDDEDLSTVLTYTNFKGEHHHKRLGDLILHVFLHQVHHRGQVTTILSQEGIDFGDTDLPEIVPEQTVY